MTPFLRPERGGAPGRIDLEGVSIRFGGFTAVEGINLTVNGGEFASLVGPSGCGKSTVLNAIAGFIAPSSGTIRVDGEPIDRPDVSRGVVFQSSDALFPWLNAEDNITFGSRVRALPRPERKRLARELLQLVGLGSCGDKFPNQLSGGMRQRLQIARVLANGPRIVLMDEPFGALDAQTREVMQGEIDRIWRKTGCTIVFVTHDLDEALLLSDSIITMTAAPNARVKNVHRIDLPHPRDADDPLVRHLHSELRLDINEEVLKTMRNEGISTA